MATRTSAYERLTGGNRKQRKDLQRRLYSDDPGLRVVHADAAGIDIGNESHFVAAPPTRDAEPVREFGSWTADLERMAVWLKSCKMETVAMQSTGVYWFAVYDVLEKHGLKVFLVNASHTKNLPGRKSDVQESQWLMKLHTYGLLRNSFRPPEEIRPIRAVWRLRDRHVQDAARNIQHMQKSLTSMNVPLANAISDISGVSGQAIIRSILAGERDTRKLARLRGRRIKASEEEVHEAWRETGRKINCSNSSRLSTSTISGKSRSANATASYRRIWLSCHPGQSLQAIPAMSSLQPSPQGKGRSGRRRQGAETPRGPSILPRN
jgi:hypothetical protein